MHTLAKYCQWTGIKAKSAFRSHSQLIQEVRKLLTRGENVNEVVNRQKVKKLKVTFWLLLAIFVDRATKVMAGAMALILTWTILILQHRVLFPTVVTIVLRIATAAFPHYSTTVS